MIGLGTLINTGTVIVGGLAGFFFGKLIPDRIQNAILKTNGVIVMFIGASGALAEMLTYEDGVFDTQKGLLLTLSMVLGTLIGEIINLEKLINRFGDWLKKKSKSSSDPRFTESFVTASCTVCIGAMSVVGALEDGLFGDPSLLITKSILDFFTIMVMTCSMGKGCIFAAIPVFVIEGLITLIAKLIEPIMTEVALADLSLVGSVLIFCIGLNLIRKDKLPVANMLPSILIAIAFAFIPALN